MFTPTDHETGICFPIVTERSLPEIGKPQRDNKVVADWNHNYHPKELLIHGTKEQIALRNVRVEWVHRDDHNRYHSEFEGPDIEGLGDLIRPMIFAAAGFIPAFGMQYDGRLNAKYISLDDETRMSLWNSGRIKVNSHNIVRDALVTRALNNDFGGVNERTIDEFLATPDRTRRFELGSSLLAMAVHDMANPLGWSYKNALKSRQLPPDAPRSVGRCAMRIISSCGRNRAIRTLATHLAAAA